MKKVLRTFLAAGFVLLALALADASGAGFTASLDRDTISLGETATLSLSFQDGQPKNVPQPNASGLQIAQTGNQTGYSIVNGAMSSTFTVLFSVTGRAPGEYTIPAMTVEIGGQQVTSQPLKLTVERPNAPSSAAVNAGSEIAFMKLDLPQQKIYSGETFVGQLKLYLRDDVQNFGNFQLTSTPADGISVGKMVEGGRFRSQVGNRVYTVVPISVALTATRAGDLSIGPFTANAVVVLPSQNNGGDPFFSQFFNQGEQKQVSLATDEVKVQSSALPAENIPPNFNGAIGNYQMTVTAGPTNVTVGDPITVRVQISGHGAFDAVNLADQSAWKDFKIFTPTSKTENSDQLGLEGTKTFEEIVTPQNSDVRALPQFSFSYFNPDDGRYHTLTKELTPLIVKAAGTSPTPTIAANNNNEQEKQAAPDISPIKQDLGPMGKNSAPLISRPAFFAVQSLPVLAFIGAFIWRKRTDALANNPRLRRQRAVAALIASGLEDLKKYAAENKPDEFFATLFRLLQEQLGERLDCPASAITENVVEEHAVLRNIPATLREALREQFQLCNQARYAPVRGSSELNSVAVQFEKLIRQLQEVKA